MIHPIEVDRKRLWLERIIYALMIGFVTIALLIATAAVWQAYFNAPPVHIVSLDTPPEHPICPGTQLDIHNQVTIDQPTVLFLYVSVMDEHTNYNMPGTAEAIGPRLHPHPSTFEQFVPWVVPDLPPGKFNRTFAVRGHDTDEDILFSFLRFEVPEDC